MNVLIVQLFPRQFEWLNKAYKGPHTIDFLDSAKDEGIPRLKAKVARADKVVVLTKFISHAHWAHIPRDKVIHSDTVNVERLVDILDTLPPDEPAVKKPPKIHIVNPERHLHSVEAIPMSTTTTRRVGNFVLTTAVPIPSESKKQTKYPFAEMRVGESFFVEEKNPKEARRMATALSAAANNYVHSSAPSSKFKVSVKEPGGVRVWRVEDRKEPMKAITVVRKKTKKRA